MNILNWIEFAALHWIFVATLICLFVYHFILRPWNHFQRHGIAFDRGLPPFGTNYRRLIGFESLGDMLKRLYYQHPNERFVGMTEMSGSVSYLIRDPELVKDITTKHFDHFVNRIIEYDEQTDPLYAHALSYLKSDAWRRMRSLLTPLYTSSKFKTIMIPAMLASKKRLMEHLEEKLDNGMAEVDMMDLATRTAIDSFSRSALGIETDVLENQSNEFKTMSDDILNHMNGMSYLVSSASSSYPRMMKFLFGVTAFSQTAAQVFQQILLDVAGERKQSRVHRQDVLGLVVNVEKSVALDDKESSKLSNYTQTDMISQCLEFFEASFTENNTILNYIAHTLADRPDIQERLRDEMLQVKQTLQSDSLSSDSLRDMKYMDMVLSEALRMCPITTELKRRATKPYTLVNTNGARIQVQPGEAVWIPSFILQNDPQYFSSPEVFDPERFSEENKGSMVAGTYAPFGLGPRDCIGCRYTVLEVKATFFYMLQSFDLFKSKVKNGNKLVLRRRVQ